MDPPYMILHVIHPAEHSATLLSAMTLPLTLDARIVLRLMPRAILLGAESTAERPVRGPRGSGLL
jgi:hypothetical protein